MKNLLLAFTLLLSITLSAQNKIPNTQLKTLGGDITNLQDNSCISLGNLVCPL